MIDCRYHLSFGVIGSIAAAVVGKVRILGDSTTVKILGAQGQGKVDT